ncbi:2-hydroxyacid dehydrogenase [Bordetella genomosp. 7]|jgi:D-3-phosphoglycerate dehydrogenase|uniref:Glycerate dehydrogenase n=1 Tax=Bordetella genomosp. 7 TaxID=1416805 RepID=A0A261QWC8_9BORD|nr:NAD(P)-dependent oxidoreductase [Bordetella genomosp. 7]OZI17089.1 glycerate dehydrogenase [Bordetella genomosp. 7]
MVAVFVDCTQELKAVIERRALPTPAGLRINYGDPTQEELVALAEDAEILCVEHTIIPAELLQACTKLKTIVFMGTGAGSYVPLDAARQRGIKVLNTPGYGNIAVAEHTMALMYAGARKIVSMDNTVRQGLWQPRGGMQLTYSKIAVVGLGDIGLTFASMALSLDMDVAGWNRTPLRAPYYTPSLLDALKGAKFLSLHLALNEHTQGIIGAKELGLLAPGAVVVNTARAALIDEHALLNALDSGQVGHAALDVLWDEPLAASNPWSSRDDVTLTPHAAYMTDEAYEELWKRTLGALASTGFPA